jgi:hypothetical protein
MILSNYNISEIFTVDFLFYRNIQKVNQINLSLCGYLLFDLIFFFKEQYIPNILHHIFTMWFLLYSYFNEIANGLILLSMSQEISSILLALSIFIEFKNNVINVLFFVNYTIFKIIIVFIQIYIILKCAYEYNDMILFNLSIPIFLIYLIFIYWFILIIKKLIKKKIKN